MYSCAVHWAAKALVRLMLLVGVSQQPDKGPEKSEFWVIYCEVLQAADTKFRPSCAAGCKSLCKIAGAGGRQAHRSGGAQALDRPWDGSHGGQACWAYPARWPHCPRPGRRNNSLPTMCNCNRHKALLPLGQKALDFLRHPPLQTLDRLRNLPCNLIQPENCLLFCAEGGGRPELCGAGHCSGAAL